ncbi:hypothetical protein B0H19DRAFT_1248915 [Mycena capillaripes]|nr:hypothetical protein B0H19DRAFT_1248915 [Mycena capillaripes]
MASIKLFYSTEAGFSPQQAAEWPSSDGSSSEQEAASSNSKNYTMLDSFVSRPLSSLSHLALKGHICANAIDIRRMSTSNQRLDSISRLDFMKKSCSTSPPSPFSLLSISMVSDVSPNDLLGGLRRFADARLGIFIVSHPLDRLEMIGLGNQLPDVSRTFSTFLCAGRKFYLCSHKYPNYRRYRRDVIFFTLAYTGRYSPSRVSVSPKLDKYSGLPTLLGSNLMYCIPPHNCGNASSATSFTSMLALISPSEF